MGKGNTRQGRRVRCSLRCEIVGLGRRAIEGRVVQLSEGGLSLVGPLPEGLEQGDGIRIRLLPHRSSAAVEVSAIVWNDEPLRGRSEEGDRGVGCLVSDPPRAFLQLFAEVLRRKTMPQGRRIPVVPSRPSSSPDAGRDLPRTREIGPPPKPAENLPTFRIRLKQIGGPRTRSLSVQAHSVAEAEALARLELESLLKSTPDWELIEVVLAR